MQKGRLFTFGCSMTRYQYPTWADILGKEWEYYENWGKGGAGNLYILNSLIECLHRNHLTKDDCVMMMWTGITRTDYYHSGTWKVFHDKFSNNTTDFPVSCPDGAEIINYSFMYAAHKILDEHDIPYQSMTWVNYFDNSPAGVLYKNTLEKIKLIEFEYNSARYKPTSTIFFEKRLENLYTMLAGQDWPTLDAIINNDYKCRNSEIEKEVKEFIKIYSSDKEINALKNEKVDQHPRPLQHLKTVDKYFSDITISTNTRQWIEDIDNSIIQGRSYKFDPSVPAERL
jgi:hypothetical protein